MEETPQMLRMQSSLLCCGGWIIFPKHCPTAAKAMLPFHKSKIFTASLKHVDFYLAFSASSPLWEAYCISQN
jgi:hypothetical protein